VSRKGETSGFGGTNPGLKGNSVNAGGRKPGHKGERGKWKEVRPSSQVFIKEKTPEAPQRKDVTIRIVY